MKMKFAIAAIIFVAAPLLAQAQQAGKLPKPSKAELQKLVEGIQSDKAKMQQYCDMRALYGQAAEAEEKKQKKKYKELTKKADAAADKLGPEYQKARAALQKVDLSSPEDQELLSVMDPLDDFCDAAGKKK
jgi:hypothetical protein